MKGKNLKQLLNNQKAKRVGCILLAAAVLGTGAWAVDNGQKSDVPELNGKGYPFHLSGEQLFYPARMVACVDIYQALREPRAYKAEKSHESAVQIMKEMAQAGEIDPMIVDDLEKLFRR